MYLTDLERKAIAAIIFDSYQQESGSPDTKASDVVDFPIWEESVISTLIYTDLIPKKSVPGILGSLSKKGCIHIRDYKLKGNHEDFKISLTLDGAESYDLDLKTIKRNLQNLEVSK
jgi:hypothetical protein